jgi:hypothetical protein
VRIHLRQVVANACEIVARAQLRLERARRGALEGAGSAELMDAIDHTALSATGPKRIESDVASEDGRPAGETALLREGASREARDDLLERRLHEIGVVVLPAPEDAHDRRVDDGTQAIVKPGPGPGVASLEGLDELLVRIGSTGRSGRARAGFRFFYEAQVRTWRTLDERLRAHMGRVTGAAVTRQRRLG